MYYIIIKLFLLIMYGKYIAPERRLLRKYFTKLCMIKKNPPGRPPSGALHNRHNVIDPARDIDIV